MIIKQNHTSSNWLRVKSWVIMGAVFTLRKRISNNKEVGMNNTSRSASKIWKSGRSLSTSIIVVSQQFSKFSNAKLVWKRGRSLIITTTLIITYRFLKSICSDCSQSLNILLPWNVFSVRLLNTTFGSGSSMWRGDCMCTWYNTII